MQISACWESIEELEQQLAAWRKSVVLRHMREVDELMREHPGPAETLPMIQAEAER